MSKKGSSLIENNYVPMIGCFVAGFVVSRLMNHQDVVTGDVKEGMDGPVQFVVVIAVVIVGSVVLTILGSTEFWEFLNAIRGKKPAGQQLGDFLNRGNPT